MKVAIFCKCGAGMDGDANGTEEQHLYDILVEFWKGHRGPEKGPTCAPSKKPVEV